MFIDVNQETGLPVRDPCHACRHPVADMKARGFQFLQTSRGVLCTEVHFNGPFQLKFDNGNTVDAEAIVSDYLGVDSSHRVVLPGAFNGHQVAFDAVPVLPPIGTQIQVKIAGGFIYGVVLGHNTKDGQQIVDYEYDHIGTDGVAVKTTKWAWPMQLKWH